MKISPQVAYTLRPRDKAAASPLPCPCPLLSKPVDDTRTSRYRQTICRHSNLCTQACRSAPFGPGNEFHLPQPILCSLKRGQDQVCGPQSCQSSPH